METPVCTPLLMDVIFILSPETSTKNMDPHAFLIFTVLDLRKTSPFKLIFIATYLYIINISITY